MTKQNRRECKFWEKGVKVGRAILRRTERKPVPKTSRQLLHPHGIDAVLLPLVEWEPIATQSYILDLKLREAGPVKTLRLKQ
jgi:hypothetical protein